MIKVAIIGASGYTGAELLRLLVRHPEVQLECAYSRTNSGRMVSAVHPDLLGQTDLVFSEALPQGADLWFLCLPHGESADFLSKHPQWQDFESDSVSGHLCFPGEPGSPKLHTS